MADLAVPGAAAKLAQQLNAMGIHIDWLVNNAGFGMRAGLAESDPDRLSQMLNLNIVALTELTRQLLPAMIERGYGGVMNVASTAAFQPGPFMAAYYASKAYVLSLTEALWQELRGTSVKVSALCPGATITEFAEVAGTSSLPMFRRGLVMQAGPVARAGYKGLLRGRRVVIPGLLNHLGALLAWLAPKRMVLSLLAAAQKPPA